MTEPLTAEAVAMALGTDVAKGPVQHKTGPISKIAATLVNELFDPFQLIVT